MLKIEYMALKDIKPYTKNSKKHPQEQIEQIKNSIQRFGFNDPVALWHGEIVEGHGRYMAAKELGMETVPVIRLDELTDEQRRAYAIIHNKLTMNTGFDLDILNSEIESLIDFDFGDFGFGDTAIQKLGENEELDIDDYADDKYECACPKCGFRFNPKDAKKA